MDTVVNSVRIPADVAAAFEDLAKQTGRTRNYLYVEALREYLAWEREDAAQMARSIAEADRGETISLDEANEETATMLSQLGVSRERQAEIAREVADGDREEARSR